jgi:predicted DNA-binding transcriptional regulator AlpA
MAEPIALLNKEELQECNVFKQQFEFRRMKLEGLIARQYENDSRIEIIKRRKLKNLCESIIEECVVSGKIEKIVIKFLHRSDNKSSNRKDRVTIRYINPDLPKDFWFDENTILTKAETSELLSMSRGTLDSWIKFINFPEEIGITSSEKGFKKPAIKEWLDGYKTSGHSPDTGFCVRNYLGFRKPRDVGNACFELVLLNRRTKSLNDLLKRIIQNRRPMCLVEFTRFAYPTILQIKEITDVILNGEEPLCAVQFVLEMKRFGREHEIHIPQFRSKSFEDSKALYFWFNLVSHNNEDINELNKFVNKLSHERVGRRKEYFECLRQMHNDDLIGPETLDRLQGTLNHFKDIDKMKLLKFDNTNDVVVDYSAICSKKDQYLFDAKEMVDFWNDDKAINPLGQESILISQIEDCNRSLLSYKNRMGELENKLKELKTPSA